MEKRAGMLAGAAVAGLLAVLASRQAGAEWGAQAAANVTEGATTNALSAPDGSPGTGLDEFTAVRAVAQGQYRGRLQDHLLSYTYTGSFFATQTEANTQDHQVLWAVNATPSGRSEVRAQVGATYAHLNSINPLAAAAGLNPMVVTGAGIVSLPNGPVTYYGATAQGTVGYRPSGTTSWSEMTSANGFIPVSGETGHSLSLAQMGHFEHQRARNALTVDAVVSYLDASNLAPDGSLPLQPSPVLQAQGTVGWRRDFSPELFFAADAGALLVDMTNGSQLSVLPVGEALLHHQTPTAVAEVRVSQSSQLNVYLGQSLVISAATARLLLPLDRLQRFRVIGLGTAGREWAIDGGHLDSALDLLAADVGLAFQPVGYPFLASLDYAAQEQIGRTVGMTAYPSLHRQAVMLTLTATWGTASTR